MRLEGVRTGGEAGGELDGGFEEGKSEDELEVLKVGVWGRDMLVGARPLLESGKGMPETRARRRPMVEKSLRISMISAHVGGR